MKKTMAVLCLLMTTTSFAKELTRAGYVAEALTLEYGELFDRTSLVEGPSFDPAVHFGNTVNALFHNPLKLALGDRVSEKELILKYSFILAGAKQTCRIFLRDMRDFFDGRKRVIIGMCNQTYFDLFDEGDKAIYIDTVVIP